MNIKSACICVVLCMYASGLFSQVKKGECVIRGTIDGINDTWISIGRIDATFTPLYPADTIPVKNGKFTYTVKADYSALYYLYTPAIRWEQRKLIVLATPGEIQVTIDINDWNKYSVTGNSLTNAFFYFSREYEEALFIFNNKPLSIPKYKRDTTRGKEIYTIIETPGLYLLKADTIDESEKKMYFLTGRTMSYGRVVTEQTEKMTTGKLIIKHYGDSSEGHVDNIFWKYLLLNKNNEIGAMIAAQHFIGKHYGKITDSVYHILSANARNSFYGKSLKNYIDFHTGSKRFDFAFTDHKGKKIKLSDVKSKYILVHFWASWCGPCRPQNKELAALYEKYDRSQLEFVNISFDISKKSWEAAIIKDSLPGYHSSQLKGFNNSIGRQFLVNVVPSSFLLNSDRKIVLDNPFLVEFIKNEIDGKN